MKYATKCLAVIATALLLSTPALAQISFSDDFEGYPIYEGGDPTDLGGGWTLFVNIFEGFPTCANYLYGYGPFPAPNGGNVSNIVAGNTANALNVFSNYADDQHANGNCLDVNVFQERILTAEDAGTYIFEFDTQVPEDLGTDVTTQGFIKLIDANNFSTLIFNTVQTETGGDKFVTVTIGEEDAGQILQWGFTNISSNYLPTGRWYDNASFGIAPPVVQPDIAGIPTLDRWGLLLMLMLVGGFGVITLIRR